MLRSFQIGLVFSLRGISSEILENVRLPVVFRRWAMPLRIGQAVLLRVQRPNGHFFARIGFVLIGHEQQVPRLIRLLWEPQSELRSRRAMLCLGPGFCRRCQAEEYLQSLIGHFGDQPMHR